MFFAFKVDNSVKFCNKVQQIWSIIQTLLSHLVENLCTTLNGEKEIHALCLVIYCIKASEYFFSSVSNSNLGCTRFEVEHISCNLHLNLFKSYTQAYFLFYERLYIDCTFFSKKS